MQYKRIQLPPQKTRYLKEAIESKSVRQLREKLYIYGDRTAQEQLNPCILKLDKYIAAN